MTKPEATYAERSLIAIFSVSKRGPSEAVIHDKKTSFARPDNGNLHLFHDDNKLAAISTIGKLGGGEGTEIEAWRFKVGLYFQPLVGQDD